MIAREIDRERGADVESRHEKQRKAGTGRKRETKRQRRGVEDTGEKQITRETEREG